MHLRALSITTTIAAALAAPGFASERDNVGHLTYQVGALDLDVAVQSEAAVDDRTPIARREAPAVRSEMDAVLRFGRRLRLDLEVGFAPTLGAAADDEESALPPAGIDVLALGYNHGFLMGSAGRIKAPFGMPATRALGLFDRAYAADGRSAEYWGVRGGVRSPAGPLGTHTATATTFLPDSAGEPAVAPPALDLAIDSSRFVLVPGLSTHVGYRRQGADGGDPGQADLSLGAAYRFGLARDWTAAPVIEYTALGRDDDAATRYLGGGLELRYRNTLSAVLQADRRLSGSPVLAGPEERLGISASYALGPGLDVGIDWRTDDGDGTGGAIGGRLSYARAF